MLNLILIHALSQLINGMLAPLQAGLSLAGRSRLGYNGERRIAL
ncbi:hypothetical protein HCH_03008 [Hahella chejuensis KCTC 2396]|uniref:Uncharacterized protein n=1 Tax=Hahella chejuensis (strain KCTC 2396) TaxID=349521 RepID=Q2SHU8_HAHCH|nr:hypothetical protein HCH_03008 [Hahella chejuensis KCTC 2396]